MLKLVRAGLVALAVILLIAAGAASLHLPDRARAQSDAQSMSDEEFGARVRQYLLQNPEVIVEVMQELQRREQLATRNDLASVIAERRSELLEDPAAPVGGNPEGDVTLVEFFDYNCPYCRRAAPVVDEAIGADDKLRVVYKEFPILGPDSEYAARAALASGRQGKYPEFHEALMAAPRQVGEGNVLGIARSVGLDVEKLQEDMKAPEIQEAIERNLELAQALGISGTPSFVIGDAVIPGLVELEQLQQAITQARDGSASPQ